MTTQSHSASDIAHVASTGRSDWLIAAVLAFILGVGLVYTTGFSQPSTIHNAAHDTRHALSFPCH